VRDFSVLEEVAQLLEEGLDRGVSGVNLGKVGL